MFILPACTGFIGGGDRPQACADHTPGKGNRNHPKKQYEPSRVNPVNRSFPSSSDLVAVKSTTPATR